MDKSKRIRITNEIRRSVLELCKNALKGEVDASDGLDIDGIICITLPRDENPLVIKMHGNFELGNETMGHIINKTPNKDSISTVTGPTRKHSLTEEEPALKSRKLTDDAPTSSPGGNTLRHPHTIHTVSIENQRVTVPEASEKQAEKSSELPRVSWQCMPEKNGKESSSGVQFHCDEDSYATISEAFMGQASLDALLNRELECHSCHQIFLTFREFKKHNSVVHNRCTCKWCWCTFSDKRQLDEHTRVHVKEQGVTPQNQKEVIQSDGQEICGICGARQRTRDSVIAHMTSVHQLKVCLTCILCNEYFPSKLSFIAHRRSHHSGIMEHLCSVCNVYFTSDEYEEHNKECEGASKSQDSASLTKMCVSQGSHSSPHHCSNYLDMLPTTLQEADRSLQLHPENLLEQILKSDHSVLMQREALQEIRKSANRSSSAESNIIAKTS